MAYMAQKVTSWVPGNLITSMKGEDEAMASPGVKST